MHDRCLGCMKIKSSAPICEHCGYDENSRNYPHQLPAGTVLGGQYLIGRVLGQGGYGITYMGWDKSLQMPVAIKEFYPNSFVTRNTGSSLEVMGSGEKADALFSRSRERFLKEAQLLAKLSGVSGVVRVQQLFEENNTAYIVMEYVRGTDLRHQMKLQKRPMTVQEAFAILKPAMYALSQVHAANLVHRDISPDNIMIQSDGQVKLLDFGAAREVSDAAVDRELPQSTEAILKDGFAPTEQYQKRGSLGPWTDVYAFCATLYYCLTGKIPNSALERVMGEDNVDWHRIQGLSARQVATLERGMALRPEDRIRSMAELWQGLFEPDSGEAEQKPRRTEAKQTEPEKQMIPEEKTPEPVPVPQKKRKPGLAVAAGLVVAAAAALLLSRTPGAELRTEETRQAATVPQITEVAQPVQMESVQTEPIQTQPQETTVPEENLETPAVAEPEPEWKKNVLMEDRAFQDDYNIFWEEKYQGRDSDVYEYFSSRTFFGGNVTRGRVTDVYFLDSLENAPENAWDVSASEDGSVLAWTVNNTKGALDLYFAGEGGINGSQASAGLFYGYTALNNVHFDGNFHTEDAASFSGMFAYCKCLLSADIETLDTSSVTDMSGLFKNCNSLKSVNAARLDTSRVTNMHAMFENCSTLQEIGLSSFDTSCVTDMGSMFRGCKAITKLNLENFDTARVTDMSYMFSGMEGMTFFDLRSVDTSQVCDMAGMFSGCKFLKNLDLRHFDTQKVTNMGYMFAGCEYLDGLDLRNFDTSLVEDMQYMFYYCRRVMDLKLDNFDTSRVTNTSHMFEQCTFLKVLHVEHFDMSQVRDITNMFHSCGRLEVLDVTGWDISSVEKSDNCFFGCDKVPMANKAINGQQIWSDFYGYREG